MKTRLLQYGITAAVGLTLFWTTGCNAKSASATNTVTAEKDPLALQPAPSVPQLPAEQPARTTNDDSTLTGAIPLTGEKQLPAQVEISPALADVVKLIQADVQQEVILSFIRNSSAPFNINAEQMDYLNDLGVPGEVSLAMIQRDYAVGAGATPSAVVASSAAGQPTSPATEGYGEAALPPTEETVVVTEPPPVTVNYFYDSLSPYGTWVDVTDYGRCWRPTVVLYQPGWRPYCDNGRWVYSNCGWYWVSDYSWGLTFHYGRWFNHPRHGWCWSPDTVWGPAWVTWRSSADYCGWAPLPPRTAFVSGLGLTYYGSTVSVGFGFGLGVDCYTFVPRSRFCDRRPHHFAVSRDRAGQIIHQTTVINNFERGDHQRIVNRGIARETIFGPHRNEASGRSRPTIDTGANRPDAANITRDNSQRPRPQREPHNQINNPARSGDLPETSRFVPRIVPPTRNTENRPNWPSGPSVIRSEVPTTTPPPMATAPGATTGTRAERDNHGRGREDIDRRTGDNAAPATVRPANRPVQIGREASSRTGNDRSGQINANTPSTTPAPSVIPPSSPSRPTGQRQQPAPPAYRMEVSRPQSNPRPSQTEVRAPAANASTMETPRPSVSLPAYRHPAPPQVSVPQTTPPAVSPPAPAPSSSRPQAHSPRSSNSGQQDRQQRDNADRGASGHR